MNTHDLDTTGWTEIPFTADGVNYISKLAPESPFLARVKNLPYGAFETMNIQAVRELVGTGLTRNEIVAKLNDINQFATHAVIDLE